MGQIIGGAAKPKRCNISQLSQLGTPAAGEHILVSSSNSMNAAGQGEFDFYIIGNNTDAAVTLAQHFINDKYGIEKIRKNAKIGGWNITTNDYVFADNGNRVAVGEFYLEKGDKIILSDYTKCRMYIGWSASDGTHGANGWKTSDFTATVSGKYVVTLEGVPSAAVSDASELTNFFFILRAENLDTINASSINDLAETTVGKKVGVNLLADNVSYIPNSLLNNSGSVAQHSSYSAYKTTADFIKIKPSTTYSTSKEGQLLRVVSFYDGNLAFISNSSANVRTFTTPANAKYIKICFKTDDAYAMLCESSTPLSYKKYSPIEGYTKEENENIWQFLEKEKCASYPTIYGAVESLVGGVTTSVLNNVQLENGHKYKARIITQETTAPSTFILKVMSSSSDSSLFDIKDFGGEELGNTEVSFEWQLASAYDYRIGFYAGALSQPIELYLYDITVDKVQKLNSKGSLYWVLGGITAGQPATSPDYLRTSIFIKCSVGDKITFPVMTGYSYTVCAYYYTSKSFSSYVSNSGYKNVSNTPISIDAAVEGCYALSLSIIGYYPTEELINNLPIVFSDVQNVVDAIGSSENTTQWGIVERNKYKESALFSVLAHAGNDSFNAAGKLSLLHLSDLHGNVANLRNIVIFRNYYDTYIDDTIHTGDSVLNYYSDPNPFESVDGANTILNVIGNHEAWIQGDNDYNATEKQTYDKIFAPSIANWGVVQPTGAAENGYCYYYKDYTAAGFRLIVLDSVHWHYRNGVSETNPAQKTWFEGVLADAITNNLRVVCATHYTPQNGIVPIPDTGFNVMGATAGGNIADGWYASDEIFGCVDAFINNGGTFAGWIVGHTHNDYIGNVYGHIAQPIVVIGTSGAISNNNKFVSGTSAQDNFNIISFETLNSKSIIKIIKIGQDTDVLTRSKSTIAYDFTNSVLISAT